MRKLLPAATDAAIISPVAALRLSPRLSRATHPDCRATDAMETLELIAGMTMPKPKPGRFRPPDTLLALRAGNARR